MLRKIASAGDTTDLNAQNLKVRERRSVAVERDRVGIHLIDTGPKYEGEMIEFKEEPESETVQDSSKYEKDGQCMIRVRSLKSEKRKSLAC